MGPVKDPALRGRTHGLIAGLRRPGKARAIYHHTVESVLISQVAEARRKIQRGQEGLLDQLLVVLGQAVGKQG